MRLNIDPLDETLLKRLTHEATLASAFRSAQDTMSIDLAQGNSKEQVTVDKGLDST
jgi:hypothetical protein